MRLSGLARRTRKINVSLVLTLILLFLGVSCGSSPPTQSKTSPSPRSGNSVTATPTFTTIATFPPSTGPFYSSLDTMKVSRDTQTHPLSQDQINAIVAISASLHNNYITVDTNWDYPAYMAQWVDAVHNAHLHVWYRGHPNQWENDNGASGQMTPGMYETAERDFILHNSGLFQYGDIFDACSEPEQGKYWFEQYQPGWTDTGPNTATREFNSFLRDTTDVADQAFKDAGKSGVITTIRSTNSFFPSTTLGNGLEAATVQRLGRITIDSYPEQSTTDPKQAADARVSELKAIENLWHVPIIIGEMGYSNDVNVDDATQEKVIRAELEAMAPLSYLAGLNYWVGTGSSSSGGYTYIISKQNGQWVLRPAATDLANFYASKAT